MDFFRYATVAMEFTETSWVWWLTGSLCFAIVFIFQAVALFTIASRSGYKNKWMAFVPFLNTYYIGVCAQKNKFYNIDTKKIGITAAVFEFVICALYIVFLVAMSLMKDSGISRTLTTRFGMEYYYYPLDSVPANLKWAAWMYNYMDEYILRVLDLLYMLILISLLICFFQTYACRRYVLFTITSILFPIQGILFFVVRNNKGSNYKEFVRTEQARQYQMYQQYYQQNPYNQNPYQQNPYNRTPYDNPPRNDSDSRSQSVPDDPFADFGGTGAPADSPFDDFDKN